MSQPASVFISYRRLDAAGHAGRLFDRLKQWFDADVLFYDLDSIDAGDAFPLRLEAAVSGAKVALVLIGPDWLAEINRRAALPTVDFVRREVELALNLKAIHGTLKVVPVLLGGAEPPSQSDLHESLRQSLGQLPALDAHEFHGKNADWDEQFVRLRGLIAGVPGVPAPRYRPPAGTPKPFRVIEHLLSPHFHDPTAALWRVRETLLAGGNAAIVVPVVLYGMGGVGKTQLALKYSLEYQDSYAGVWWFRAEAENTLQLDARDACLEAGVPLDEGEPPPAALKRWLVRQEQSWLLVFDNAESAETLRPHMPQGGPHHVLITSRDPAWGGVARPIELAVWSEEEGADFLGTRLPAARPADLQRLSRLLGGLQLALEQAAAFLEQTGGAVTDYCDEVEGVDTAGLVLDEGRASTGYERSVLATLSLAFPRLSQAAQELLRISAFYGAEPIPERYFREAIDHLPMALGSAVGKGLTWERTVAELRRLGIVKRPDVASLDRTPGQLNERMEKALVLHRLTLEVARHALSVPAEDGSRAQKLLHSQCPSEANDPKTWPRFALLLPHLLNIERLGSGDWLDRRIHSRMLDRAALYLQHGPALYQQAVRLQRRVVELDKADLGEENTLTLSSMSSLAGTLQTKGDLSGALELHLQVLSIRRRQHGDEDIDTLISMNAVARTLLVQGDFRGARILQEKVVTTSSRVLGEEFPWTLIWMSQLVDTLAREGDLTRAQELLERVLSISLRTGKDHPDTLRAMNNVAHALWTQGDFSSASALLERIVEIRRRVMGEEHLETLSAMHNLAVTLSQQGDHSGARALYEQVLSIFRRTLGEEHPDTLTAMNSLAVTLWALEVRDDAVKLMLAVVEGRISKLGAEHSDTEDSLQTLAAWRGSMN